MGTVDFDAFDADNHYYEATDAFTRHLPANRSRLVTWATINGVVQQLGTQERYRVCVAGRCTELVAVGKPQPPPLATTKWATIDAVIQQFGTQNRFRICRAAQCAELAVR